jgi:hypothetical protein
LKWDTIAKGLHCDCWDEEKPGAPRVAEFQFPCCFCGILHTPNVLKTLSCTPIVREFKSDAYQGTLSFRTKYNADGGVDYILDFFADDGLYVDESGSITIEFIDKSGFATTLRNPRMSRHWVVMHKETKLSAEESKL